MPEVAARYAEGQGVAELRTVYQDLLTAFMDDSAKYAGGGMQASVLRHCIESAPSAAGTRIAFAGFGNSAYGSREVGEALRALQRAMLVRITFPTTATELPLLPDKRKSPRLHFLDTGLMNFHAGLQPQLLTVENLHGVHRGLIAEHIVGQELLARSTSPLQNLVFWVRESPQSNAEVDYLVEYEGQVVPVEVKSGTTGTLRSLHQFMSRSRSPLAVRLYAGELHLETISVASGRPFALLNAPYYLASELDSYLAWAPKSR
jgi:predicted AAA+ superfamily ATPase